MVSPAAIPKAVFLEWSRNLRRLKLVMIRILLAGKRSVGEIATTFVPISRTTCNHLDAKPPQNIAIP